MAVNSTLLVLIIKNGKCNKKTIGMAQTPMLPFINSKTVSDAVSNPVLALFSSRRFAINPS